jgi:hypothetical protein
MLADSKQTRHVIATTKEYGSKQNQEWNDMRENALGRNREDHRPEKAADEAWQKHGRQQAARWNVFSIGYRAADRPRADRGGIGRIGLDRGDSECDKSRK